MFSVYNQIQNISMRKLLVLIVCLFSASSFAKASDRFLADDTAPNGAVRTITLSLQFQTCELLYKGPSQQACETGADGVTTCWEDSSPLSIAYLNSASAANSEFADPNIDLLELNFSGANCDKCQVELWSLANYQGDSLVKSFSEISGGAIVVKDVWPQSSGSFKVNCLF